MTEPKVLWQQLQQAGLVTGELPVLAPNDPQPAFFLRMLLGVSGGYRRCFFVALFPLFLSASSPTAKTSGGWVLSSAPSVSGSVVLIKFLCS